MPRNPIAEMWYQIINITRNLNRNTRVITSFDLMESPFF